MRWLDSIIDELCQTPCCGYRPDAPPATEPTALSAIALTIHGKRNAADQATEWLASLQTEEGSLADGTGSGVFFGNQTPRMGSRLTEKDSRPPQRRIRLGEPTPHWQTSLAILAWITVDAARYSKQIAAAINWTLSTQGARIEPTEDMGHDTQLIAWPWIEGTHSWVEPTALHVRALKAAGHSSHPRTREAIKLLIDRQLPAGGCNYGNTEVLGQALLPHEQPTGLAMLALAGESDEQGRIDRSLSYLKQALSARTATASLCWGVLGLSAHDQRPADAGLWLESAYGRTNCRDRAPYKLALLALAAASAKGTL